MVPAALERLPVITNRTQQAQSSAAARLRDAMVERSGLRRAGSPIHVSWASTDTCAGASGISPLSAATAAPGRAAASSASRAFSRGRTQSCHRRLDRRLRRHIAVLARVPQLGPEHGQPTLALGGLDRALPFQPARGIARLSDLRGQARDRGQLLFAQPADLDLEFGRCDGLGRGGQGRRVRLRMRSGRGGFGCPDRSRRGQGTETGRTGGSLRPVTRGVN
jgi:hypothetical protein